MRMPIIIDNNYCQISFAVVHCSANEKKCLNSSHCIFASFWCDTDPDCDDKSDELHCECPFDDDNNAMVTNVVFCAILQETLYLGQRARRNLHVHGHTTPCCSPFGLSQPGRHSPFGLSQPGCHSG